jgi:hypothetical protein
VYFSEPKSKYTRRNKKERGFVFLSFYDTIYLGFVLFVSIIVNTYLVIIHKFSLIFLKFANLNFKDWYHYITYGMVSRYVLLYPVPTVNCSNVILRLNRVLVGQVAWDLVMLGS